MAAANWLRQAFSIEGKYGRLRRYILVAALTFPPALCLRFALYALLVPDLATKAKAALRKDKEAPLSEPLQQILRNSSFRPADTQPHPLLGKEAVDFTLVDDQGRPVRLHQILEERPVVLVFYYGYYCSHCVSQLFGVHEDIRLFRELGAEVIAVSGDPPSLTAERFEEFGRFDFPVLSDPGNSVAAQYGVYFPDAPKDDPELLHGTFVIGKDRRIHWAYRGLAPFVDNKTLLVQLASRLGERSQAAQKNALFVQQ